jgi:hypothetical protein
MPLPPLRPIGYPFSTRVIIQPTLTPLHRPSVEPKAQVLPTPPCPLPPRRSVADQQTPEAISFILSDPRCGDNFFPITTLRKVIDAADAAHCLEAGAKCGRSLWAGAQANGSNPRSLGVWKYRLRIAVGQNQAPPRRARGRPIRQARLRSVVVGAPATSHEIVGLQTSRTRTSRRGPKGAQHNIHAGPDSRTSPFSQIPPSLGLRRACRLVTIPCKSRWPQWKLPKWTPDRPLHPTFPHGEVADFSMKVSENLNLGVSFVILAPCAESCGQDPREWPRSPRVGV